MRKEKDGSWARPILEVNPFRDIEWLRNKVFIEIDQEKEKARHSSVVYDAPTHALYEYFNGVWKKIEEKEMFVR